MRAATLNDVADWGSGGTPKRSVREYFGSEIPWLSIADLNDGVVTEAKESLTKEGLANSSAKLVPAGTLFIAMYGSIGKLGIAGREMATSQAIAFAKPRTDVVDRRYLFHFLLAQRAKFQLRGRGGTQMNIGQADLKAWPIPLPELAEQRRISDILDKADALRAKRREAIDCLDALRQSTFHEMFGLPSQNNLGWPIVSIGSLLISAEYGTSEKSEKTGTIPVLRMGNLTYEGHLKLTDLKYLAEGSEAIEKFLLSRGDVVFNRTNSPDLVGKTALFNEADPYSFAGYLIRLRCGADLDPQYLTSFMNTPDTKAKLRSMCKSIVGMANINAKEVKAMSIMHPPIELQKDFARRIAGIELLKSKHRAQLAELDELFYSLQCRAFKGEL